MPSRQPRLILLLSLAQHRLLKGADAAFKDALGISTTQLGVLFLLQKKPGSMFREVSDALGINASALTGLVDRMEEGGLVRRRPSKDDHRAFHLFATAEGLGKAAAAKPMLARLNARLSEDSSEREIATVGRFLDAILERF